MVTLKGTFRIDHENIESGWRIYGTGGDFELLFGWSWLPRQWSFSKDVEQLPPAVRELQWLDLRRYAKDRSKGTAWIHREPVYALVVSLFKFLASMTND